MIFIKKTRDGMCVESQAVFDCAGVGILEGGPDVYIERARGTIITVILHDAGEAEAVFRQICEAQGHPERTVTIEAKDLCIFECQYRLDEDE